MLIYIYLKLYGGDFWTSIFMINSESENKLNLEEALTNFDELIEIFQPLI